MFDLVLSGVKGLNMNTVSDRQSPIQHKKEMTPKWIHHNTNLPSFFPNLLTWIAMSEPANAEDIES